MKNAIITLVYALTLFAGFGGVAAGVAHAQEFNRPAYNLSLGYAKMGAAASERKD